MFYFYHGGQELECEQLHSFAYEDITLCIFSSLLAFAIVIVHMTCLGPASERDYVSSLKFVKILGIGIRTRSHPTFLSLRLFSSARLRLRSRAAPLAALRATLTSDSCSVAGRSYQCCSFVFGYLYRDETGSVIMVSKDVASERDDCT